MSRDAESSSEGFWETATHHLRRWGHWYAGCGIFAAALLWFSGLLGFRGIGPAGVTLGEAAEDASFASTAALRSPHPFSELLAAWLGSGLGLRAMPTLELISLVSAAAAVPAVAGMAAQLGGRWSAAATAVVFTTLPAVAGAATTLGTAAIFTGVWAWFLRLLVVDRHRWYTSALLWLLGAILVLTWPPFLLWGALWLYLELREADLSSAAPGHLEGEYAAAAVPAGVALAPLGIAIVATLLHPALTTHLLGGWRAFARFVLEWSGPAFSYAGTTYAESRPPPWTGFLLLWWTIPGLALAAATGGWLKIAAADWRKSRGGRLAQRACLWGIPLLALLPWLHRGPNWGDLHFTVVLAPLLAVAAGVAVGVGLESTADRVDDWLGPTAARIVPSVLGLVLAGLFVAVAVRAHPVQGSYYSPLAGGFDRAVETGLTVSRDDVYPVQVLRRARAQTDAASMTVIGERDLVQQYVRLGLLEGVQPSESPGSADARVRRLDRFDAGSTSALKTPGALVDLSGNSKPLLRIDGVPIFWLEGDSEYTGGGRIQ